MEKYIPYFHLVTLISLKKNISILGLWCVNKKREWLKDILYIQELWTKRRGLLQWQQIGNRREEGHREEKKNNSKRQACQGEEIAAQD